MNWGNKIVVAFVLFIGFIMYMVVVSFQQNIDLVADDYYAQEVNYNAKMQKMANAEDLDKKVSVAQADDEIVITFPSGMEGSSGEIHFYHPSRELFDQTLDIDLDNSGKQTIARKDLVSARYRVNITWELDGKSYFQQEKIFVK